MFARIILVLTLCSAVVARADNTSTNKPGALQQTFGKPTHVNDNAFHVNDNAYHVNANATHVNDKPAPVKAMNSATSTFKVPDDTKIQVGADTTATIDNLHVGDIVSIVYRKHGTNQVASLIVNAGTPTAAKNREHIFLGKIQSFDASSKLLVMTPLSPTPP